MKSKHQRKTKLEHRPGLDSRLVSHHHNLGDIRCTRCGVSRQVDFNCEIPLPKGQCPEPERRKREFICFSCERILREEVRAGHLEITRGAEIGPGRYDAATVFRNIRDIVLGRL